jgi:hypothetical protein
MDVIWTAKHLGRKAADAGDGGEHFDGYAKRFDVAVDLLVDGGNGRIQRVEMVEVDAQHEAVMSRHSSAQRRLQFRRRSSDTPMRQRRQSPGIGLAVDQSFSMRMTYAAIYADL